MSYLFNHLRFVAALTKYEYERFPTGTTGKEAIHHKLNAVAKETTARCQDNLELWLQIVRLRFNIYHTTAAATGALFRQCRPQELLVKAMHGISLFTNPK